MTDDKESEQRNELLDHAFRNTVQLAAELATPPQNVQVRAGDISIEVNWQAVQPVGTVGPAATVLPAAVEPVPVVDRDMRYLTAPTVGVFYLALEPGADPFVCVGDTVTIGQQVAIIEAMKLMIPLEAECVGRVVEVLKANGESVEYGEKVFALSEADAG